MVSPPPVLSNARIRLIVFRVGVEDLAGMAVSQAVALIGPDGLGSHIRCDRSGLAFERCASPHARRGCLVTDGRQRPMRSSWWCVRGLDRPDVGGGVRHRAGKPAGPATGRRRERVLDVQPKDAARVRLLASGRANETTLMTPGRWRSRRCARASGGRSGAGRTCARSIWPGRRSPPPWSARIRARHTAPWRPSPAGRAGVAGRGHGEPLGVADLGCRFSRCGWVGLRSGRAACGVKGLAGPLVAGENLGHAG